MNFRRARTASLLAVSVMTLGLSACDAGQPAAPPAPPGATTPAEPAAVAPPAPAPAPAVVATPAPPAEPAPAEPAPAEPAPAEPAPAEPATAEPATVEPATVEPATVEPATVEPAPAATGPSTTDPKADPAVAGPEPGYDVSCPDGATQAEKCQVGKDTYVGWRSFATHCVQCHGGSAMGSTFAPNLAERFNTRVDWLRFNYVMHNGYTGKVGAMPSFAKNNAVLKDLGAIYGYLRARADNALPPGRPVKKP